jgi:hypothetical protein
MLISGSILVAAFTVVRHFASGLAHHAHHGAVRLCFYYNDLDLTLVHSKGRLWFASWSAGVSAIVMPPSPSWRRRSSSAGRVITSLVSCWWRSRLAGGVDG